jgi:hypothetical protein
MALSLGQVRRLEVRFGCLLCPSISQAWWPSAPLRCVTERFSVSVCLDVNLDPGYHWANGALSTLEPTLLSMRQGHRAWMFGEKGAGVRLGSRDALHRASCFETAVFSIPFSPNGSMSKKVSK